MTSQQKARTEALKGRPSWRSISYREFVEKSLLGFEDRADSMTLAALGLAGEAGEVADIIKKEVWHGKPRDRQHLIEELGDVRWYLELAAKILGVSMKQIEHANREKLVKRYPTGFATMSDE